MLAVATDADNAALGNPRAAGQVLSELSRAVPARRRNRRGTVSQPGDLAGIALSHTSLESIRQNDGVLEFATLGSGNHFIEIQADEDGRLWLMIHSGSRALGQAIRDHHLIHAGSVSSRLRALEAKSDAGAEYLHDASYARRYAEASRRAMAEELGGVLARTLGAHICWETIITTDHNHVSLETHGGHDFWVHRKGAMSARLGELGVLPGSMGSPSFHVEGRGEEAALCSSAHGAGRALSRTAARDKVSERELRRQMAGIWYDFRLTGDFVTRRPQRTKTSGLC